MKSVLCTLFGHSWERRNEWSPSKDSPVVDRVTEHRTCKRCDAKESEVWFDREEEERGL